MDHRPKQAIAFLAGSFDPVHFGHLRPAIEIRDALNLGTLFLMPNRIAPHKNQAKCSAKQRVKMLELAIVNQSKIRIDTRELQRESVSYSIDSLIELKKEYPSTPICFIIGMDSLLYFDKWHRWQEILEYCHLIISERPGWKMKLSAPLQRLVMRCQSTCHDDLHQLQNGKIYFQKTTQLAISSTKIRALTNEKHSISYLSPEAVCDYIKKNRLYLI